MPRWVGALLGAEGFVLPPEWMQWWIPASAIASAGMAIVEGWAFSYVFEKWRNQTDRDGDNLLYFALFSAALFVGVLAPYIAAQVRQVTLKVVLANGWALGAWSIAVGASTIAIVASVGYAQKHAAKRNPAKATAQAAQTVTQPPAEPTQTETQAAQELPFACAQCDNRYASQQALAAHMRSHKNGHAHEPAQITQEA